LSLRQLQREESAAREVLADYLWAAHGLTAKAQDMARMAASVGSPAEPGKAAPTLSQELEWLERSAPVVSADVGEVIGKVLETVRPLLETGGVLVEYVPPEPPLRLNLQTAVLRQALINAASIAVRHAPSGCLCISAQADPEQLIVDVRSLAERRLTGVRLDETNEGLRITGELLRLSRGALQILPVNAPEVFAARIMLPIGRLVTVLVVDDNADTLQLFHRYLSGSRYQFVGAQNARQALALAEETFPQVRVSQNFRSPNRAVIMAGSSTTP
jgi:CheY-like chemotaxis protein